MSEILSRTFRKPVLVVFVLAGLIAALVGVSVTTTERSSTAEPVRTDPSAALVAEITQMKQRLDRVPGDAIGWAGLDGSYVELARITGAPENYGEAQVEVLRLAARGLSNRLIAAELVLSERTVGHHLAHIYDKTGRRTRAGAAVFAMEHGLIPE